MSTAADRLKEPSTWAGIGGFITALALAWQTKDVVMGVGALASLVAMFKRG